ncbi:ATP-binding protein [Phytohabitans sp. ZYX-F-186]|uniref:ATP-binding protein n=1 Tax=Phytohabitans maris TaxID=3071409 RepID=A0ABU0ZJ44_9ACTN|nr:ATP-binding protein [Phytohabitans sp. ZYX-F-186]MDQ7907069.1 ATP-binding protein [Phytohabitans sp. ZYX-F-186]
MGRPERGLDTVDGPVERFVAELRDLRRSAGNPSYRELAKRAHYAPTTFSSAVSGYRLPTLEVTLAFVTACEGDVGRWEERWRQADSQARATSTRSTEGVGRAPYRGLGPYQPHHAEWFFGRDRLVNRLTAMLAVRRVVVVSGPSGTGKSSLLRAGLIPRLAAGPARPAWLPILMTPGRRPAAELARRLAEVAARTPHEVALAVVVDQFDELFTRGVGEAEQAEFLARLRALVRAPDSRHRAVVGVRAEYSARTADLLCGVANGVGRLGVEEMTGPELRESIVRAARQAGLAVERSLVARIAAGAPGTPHALPRISHALLEAWRRRRGVIVTLAGYEAAGGISGAVEQTAESVHAALSASERQALRSTLQRLARLDSAGNVSLLERVPIGGHAAAVGRMAAAGLLATTSDTVEIPHAALVTAWPRLRAWLRDDPSKPRIADLSSSYRPAS